MPLDMERLSHLSSLIHLHEKAQGHPKLKAISDEAMKQLEEAAKSLEPEKPEPVEAAEPVDPGQDIKNIEQPANEPDETESVRSSRR